MAELQALTDHLGTMLLQLSDAERKKLETEIGRKVRTSQKKRITRQMNPMGERFAPRKNRIMDKRNKIKNKMFNKIKNSKWMRIQKTSEGVAIGFTGRVAFIAGVHQFGLRDKVEKDGPTVKYSSREILGFTAEEIKMIEQEVLAHISSK